MKTIKQVEITPVFVDFIPPKHLMEQNKVYVTLEYETAVHLCLCGCGELVVTPFDAVTGWILSRDKDKISLSPSIGNYQFECKSHYIITKNKANFV